MPVSSPLHRARPGTALGSNGGHRAQMLHRHREQQDVGLRHGMGEGEVFRQGDAGQTRVLAGGAHGGGVCGVARPEGDVFAGTAHSARPGRCPRRPRR